MIQRTNRIVRDLNVFSMYDYMDGTKHLKGTSHYWDMKDKEAVYRDFLYGKEDDDDLADDEDQDDPVDYDDDDVI